MRKEILERYGDPAPDPVLEKIKEEVRAASSPVVKSMSIKYNKRTEEYILIYETYFYWMGDVEKINEVVFKRYGYKIRNIHVYPKDNNTVEIFLFFVKGGI
jgi:hypothetical protein